MSSYRYFILMIYVAGIICPRVQAQSQSLIVERHGSHLRVAALQLHFLEGKPLEQLHNGASVIYAFELTLTADQKSTPVTCLHERFILSFDLWEEKFSVVQAGPSGRSGSHLTAAMAETWCLDNLLMPIPALTPEKNLRDKVGMPDSGK